MKSKEKLETTLKTVKAKMTARADEVKAIKKTLEEFRVGEDKLSPWGEPFFKKKE